MVRLHGGAQDAVASRIAILALAEACGLQASQLLDGVLDEAVGEALQRKEDFVGCAVC